MPQRFNLMSLLACGLFLAAAPVMAQKAVPSTGTEVGSEKAEVPLNKRTAVIAVLDKRQRTTAEFTLKPGETFQFGRLSGVLQSCETTQPYERKQSGAFVQVDEAPLEVGNKKPTAAALKRVFSGWLFAESPALNPFVHPVYDVWLKSCTMRFPDSPKPASPQGATRKSAAAKSDAAKSVSPSANVASANPGTSSAE